MHDTQASNPLFASMFEAAGTMFCLLDQQHRIAHLNPFGAKLLGTEVPAALGKDFIAEFLPVAERERLAELLTSTAASPDTQDITFPIITGQGQTRMLGAILARVPSTEGVAGVLMNAHDLTPYMLERKQTELEARHNEARLESLLRITQVDAPDEQALLEYALEEAIALTGSAIGYIYHYDEQTRRFTLNTWSKEVMRACSILAPKTQYDLDKTGIWGEAVRQGKPIVINDFAAPNPLKRGCPEGHAPLRRFMTIPVRSAGRIVAVLGLANKLAEYENADVRQAMLLMDAVWRMVEQRRAEADRKQNASMLNLALRAAQMGNWHLDFSTAQCSFDAQAARLLGLEPANFHGSADEFLKTVHPEDRGKVLECLHRATAEGVACEVDYRVVWPDGQVRDLCIRGAVAYDPNGLAIRIDGVLWETGDRKRAQEIDEHLRVSFEKGAVPQALSSVEGRFIKVNEAFAKMLGTPRHDLEGHAFSEVTHPDDQGVSQSVLQDLLNGADRAHFEKRYLTRDRTLVWVEANVAPVRSPDGQARYFIGTFIDITERRRAREVLEESENNFRTFFESTTDMIAVADLQGAHPVRQHRLGPNPGLQQAGACAHDRVGPSPRGSWPRGRAVVQRGSQGGKGRMPSTVCRQERAAHPRGHAPVEGKMERRRLHLLPFRGPDNRARGATTLRTAVPQQPRGHDPLGASRASNRRRERCLSQGTRLRQG
jgi:PAS domain S-box-containing protein